MDTWYLLHTKPYKENFLQLEMQARQIECFYPQIRVHTKKSRNKEYRPYFPGYLFVKIKPGSQQANEFRWFPGVVGWVCFGEDPACVPESLIKGIRSHIDSINKNGGKTLKRIKKGAPIEVIGGPFHGYHGVLETRVSGRERVSVLIKLIHSQQKKVVMPSSLIRIKEKR